MTISDAISAVRVMLGEEPKKVDVKQTEDEKKEVMLAEDVLVDGTPVYSEGALEVGATLYVKTPEGEEDVLAPIGKHETESGLIVTVGEGGLVESIDEVVVDAVEDTVVTEELESEEPKKEEMDAENLLEAIADMIKGYSKEVIEVKEELSQLTERFDAVADLPAAQPVKKSFMKEAKAAKLVADARIDHLSSLRRKSLTK